MKVLLIQPTFTAILPENYGRPALYEPIGLAYLAAALREHGHEPILLDCVAEDWRTQQYGGGFTRVGMTDAAIAARLREEQPGLIGITYQFTGFERDGARIAALAKKTLPAVPVVVGGADASARADAFIQDPSIDLVIRGEGETTLVEIADRLEHEGALPDDAAGTTTKRRVNPARKEIADVDTIPFPARDLLPMETYLEDQDPLMPFAKRRPIGFLVSSRGCPYNCIFCSTTKVWKRWRPRSPENVVDEIQHLAERYGVREIAFEDDSFLVDADRVRGICEEMLRRGIRVAWSVPPGLKANRLTEDLLRLMKRTGFYRACFPIESGDPEVLRWMRKPIEFDEAEEAIDLCNRLGIWTYGNFIIGFPEQTADSIERTAQYAINSRLDMISVYVAQPYAGSELYEIFDRLGLLDAEKAATSTVFNSRYDTLHFSAEELRALRDDIHNRFMKRRIRRLFTPRGLAELWAKTNRPGSLAYALRVFWILARQHIQAGRLNAFASLPKRGEDIVRIKLEEGQ